MSQIFVMSWTEREDNGCSSDDGYSVHPTFNAAVAFAKDYFEGKPKRAPIQYRQPDGPIGQECYVWKGSISKKAEELFQFKKGQAGIRILPFETDECKIASRVVQRGTEMCFNPFQ